MTDANNKSPERHWFITKALDATLIVAVMYGVLYICGYNFYEAYYGTLGLPVDFLNLSINDILMFGSIPVLVMIIGTFTSFIIIAAFNNLSKKPPESIPFKKFSVPPLLLMSIAAVVIVIVIVGLAWWSSDKGTTRAQNFLAGQCPLSELTFMTNKDESKTRIIGCLIAINNENYWIKEIDSTAKLKTKILLLPSSHFVSGTIHGPLCCMSSADLSNILKSNFKNATHPSIPDKRVIVTKTKNGTL